MLDQPAGKEPDTLTTGNKRGLFILNIICALAHLLQGIAILVISDPALIPVQFTAAAGAPGSGVYSVPTVLFNMRVEIAIAVFLFFAAVDHGLVLVPPIWDQYKIWVSRGVNPMRWIEYSISASIMLVLISLISGITEVTSLINGFGANAAMIFFGLIQEQVNVGYLDGEGKVNWWPFIFGTIIGLIPWISISLSLGLAQTYCLDGVNATTYTVYSTTTSMATVVPNATAVPMEQTCIPPFVFGVFASLLICFMSFALNMLLQYLLVWKWKHGYFSEYVYLCLSLIAKSLLAWQVYAGAIAGAT